MAKSAHTAKPEPSERPPEDPAWFQLFNEIGIINQLASTAFERVLPPPLSLAGFTVLNHLARLPGDWGPARLAKAFQVTKGAMTNTLQRLEAAGFVEIELDPVDGRKKYVRLTAAGRAARKDAVKRVAPLLSEIGAAFDVEDAHAILPVLRRIRAWLDENR